MCGCFGASAMVRIGAKQMSVPSMILHQSSRDLLLNTLVSFSFSAGQAFAVLSGDEIEPGLYETDGTVTAESPGVRLHAVQFTPVPPSPS